MRRREFIALLGGAGGGVALHGAGAAASNAIAEKSSGHACADEEPTVSRTARAPEEERAPPINGIDAFFKAHD